MDYHKCIKCSTELPFSTSSQAVTCGVCGAVNDLANAKVTDRKEASSSNKKTKDKSSFWAGIFGSDSGGGDGGCDGGAC